MKKLEIRDSSGVEYNLTVDSAVTGKDIMGILSRAIDSEEEFVYFSGEGGDMVLIPIADIKSILLTNKI